MTEDSKAANAAWVSYDPQAADLPWDAIKAIRAAFFAGFDAALTAEPAAKAEPVAWLYEAIGVGGEGILTQRRIAKYRNMPLSWTETPLYAHPPSPQPDMGSDEGRDTLTNRVLMDSRCRFAEKFPAKAYVVALHDVVSMLADAALSTLPHKEEATPAPVGEGAVAMTPTLGRFKNPRFVGLKCSRCGKKDWSFYD